MTDSKLDEISVLEHLIGYTPHQFWTTKVKDLRPPITDETKPLIRRWIIARGVPESKVWAMSDQSLQTCYYGPKGYLDKVLEDNLPPRRTRRGFGHGVLNLDEGFKPNELSRGVPLGDLLDLNKVEPPISDVPTPPVQIDIAAIARAADAVIQSRLDKIPLEIARQVNERISAQLPPAVSDAVQDEINQATLTNLLRAEIRQLTLRAAEDFLEKALPHRIEIKLPNGEIRNIPSEPRHKVFDKCLKRLLIGRHVYLVGGAGTGKTHLFKQLAQALDRPVTILGQALTKYEFSGHIGPTGEYVKTLLRTAVEEGHLLAIDEIDMSAAAAIGFLNSLTANRYVAFPDKMVEAHENFVVIAAANTTGFGATQQYIGRNPLDAASLDRFVYVECDYDPDLEFQIYGRGPWIKYIHRVRDAAKQIAPNHIISMRAIERCLDGASLGETPDEIAQQGLWRNLAPDTVAKIKNLAGEPPSIRTESRDSQLQDAALQDAADD